MRLGDGAKKLHERSLFKVLYHDEFVKNLANKNKERKKIIVKKMSLSDFFSKPPPLSNHLSAMETGLSGRTGSLI